MKRERRKRPKSLLNFILIAILVLEIVAIFAISEQTLIGDAIKSVVGTKLPSKQPLCTPTKEICDGKDNDCDGKVDEGGVCEQESISQTLTYPQTPEEKLREINSNIKKKSGTWEAGSNPIFLKTDEEKKMLCGLKGEPSPLKKIITKSENTTLPDFFDWRDAHDNNYITSIKDQGNCGSCWAFAAVAALEGHANAYYNNPNLDINLSEQDLVSCFHGEGCYGAYDYQIEQIFSNYYQNYGIATEECFPYTATNNNCSNKCSNWQQDAWKTLGYQSVPLTVNDIKQAVINYGPVEVGMTVYNDFFAYTGGIYSHTTETISGYHAVTIVGFGVYDGMDYWIVKNSWGEDWGENGYFRIIAWDSGIDSRFAFVVTQPNPPQPQNKICNDNDHDGYCNWGLGVKPANCPVCNNTVEDCDDSNNSIFEGCGANPEITGTLIINSFPDNADIYIKEFKGDNWIYRGKSNTSFNLKVGEREIKIKKDYCEDYLVNVTILEDQPSLINVKLSFLPRLIYPENYSVFRLGSIIQINGTLPINYSHYKLEYEKQNNPGVWNIIFQDVIEEEIIESLIYPFNTTGLEEGPIAIKLTLFKSDENFVELLSKNISLDSMLKEGWPNKIFKSFTYSLVDDIDNDGLEEIIITSSAYNPSDPCEDPLYKYNSYVQIFGPYGDKKMEKFFKCGTISSPSIFKSRAGKLVSFIINDNLGNLHLFLIHNNGTIILEKILINEEIYSSTYGYHSFVTIGDINLDEFDEILFFGLVSYCFYAFNEIGNNISGWPVCLEERPTSFFHLLSIANVFGDERKEVAAPTRKHVYLFTFEGNNATGWPKETLFPSPATMADINGDGNLEILVIDSPPIKLHAWNYSGQDISSFPIEVNASNYPIIVSDLNNDGALEIIFVNPIYLFSDNYNFTLNILEKNGTYYDIRTFSFYLGKSGIASVIPLIVDITGDSNKEVILTTNPSPSYSEILVYSSTGTLLLRKILFGAITSAPIVSDLDNNGKEDLVVVTSDPSNNEMSKLFVFEFNKKSGNEKNEYRMIGYNPQHTNCYNCLPKCPDSTPYGQCNNQNEICVDGNLYLLGNLNGDNKVEMGDIIALINYLFRGEPFPNLPLQVGDVNMNGATEMGDVIYLINYLYKFGPAPCHPVEGMQSQKKDYTYEEAMKMLEDAQR